MELSAYEKERLANIEANKAKLVELGIDEAVTDIRAQKKPVSRKRPRDAKPPAKPTRASGRLAGEVIVEEVSGSAALDALDALEDKAKGYLDPLKRASNVPRLTPEQSAKLNSLEPVSAGPLSAEELEAVELARDDQVSERTAGGWAAHKAKGTNMYAEKRAILRASASEHGLRWPTWLGKIQAALPPMGTTETARDQTMFAIERAACGLGLDYKAWPEGVGVLLRTQERPEIGPGLYTTSDVLAILRAQGGREHTTAKRVREALETELGLEPGALKHCKDDIFAKIAAAFEQLDREQQGGADAAPGEPTASASTAALQAAKAALSSTPRILTLGSDTEVLRREGQRLEAKYGRDAGNGWAYNHALGKLRLYQEKLLRENFGETPSAPSVRELEEGAEEEE